MFDFHLTFNIDVIVDEWLQVLSKWVFLPSNWYVIILKLVFFLQLSPLWIFIYARYRSRRSSVIVGWFTQCLYR
uniref:Uncharacterized protein n=1 Tax=Lepeophtheirus salmonis TaxID=72036 RepID=A0A0K2U1Y1_LEPSM